MSWDTTTPPGSEAISNGDNRIREMKVDIQAALQAQGSFPGSDPSNPKYKWIPEYNDNASRPTSNLVTGQLYISSDSKALQRYNGAVWSNIDLLPDSGVTAAKIATSVAGNGLSGGGGTALAVNVDGSTIVIASDILGIPNGGITATQLATSVAGNGLSGGGGTALAVNVDDSTIEISSDSLRVKDSGITLAKLATEVLNRMGQSIGIVEKATYSSTVGLAPYATVVDYVGKGRFRSAYFAIGNSAGSNDVMNIRITIDGIVEELGFNEGEGLFWMLYLAEADKHEIWRLAPYGGSYPYSDTDVLFNQGLKVEIKVTNSNVTVNPYSSIVLYEREP